MTPRGQWSTSAALRDAASGTRYVARVNRARLPRSRLRQSSFARLRAYDVEGEHLSGRTEGSVYLRASMALRTLAARVAAPGRSPWTQIEIVSAG